MPSTAPLTVFVTSNDPNRRAVGLVTTIGGVVESGGVTVTGALTTSGSQMYDGSPSTGWPPAPAWSSVAVQTDPTSTPDRRAGVAWVADQVVTIGASVPYWQLIVPVNARS